MSTTTRKVKVSVTATVAALLAIGARGRLLRPEKYYPD